MRNVLLEVTGRSASAQHAVRAVGDELRRLPNAQTVTVKTEVAKGLADVRAMRAELGKIDRERVSPEVNVKITKALLDIDAFEANLRAIPNNKTVDIKVRQGILRDLAAIEKGTLGIVRGLDQASKSNFGEKIGGFFQGVKSLTPIVNSLGILVAVKLVPAFLALAASAASAAGGLLLVGNALLVAAGPAVVLLIGVVVRLVKVLKALKAQDDARDSTARRGAAASKQQAAAAKARAAAATGERDALQGLTTAERNLRQARADAGRAIADAQERARATSQDLAAAQQNVRDETVNAYTAMREAIEGVKDAMLDVKDAELGVDKAQLDTADAAASLRDYRAELGATGKTFGDLFKKFTDVDVAFDPKQFKEALKGAGGSVDDDQSRELERRVLALREAKLGEQHATNRLRDSEQSLGQARRENAKFQQQGIQAFAPYTQAIRSQEDAQRAANDAADDAHRLEIQGVKNAPAVIAAREGVRNAEQRLADARKKVRAVARDGTLTEQQLKAKQLTDKLSSAEQRFLVTLQRVRTELKGFLGPAIEQVFGAMNRALGRAPALLNPLRGEFTKLGQAWAFVIDKFSGELIKPEWVNALKTFTRESGVLARILLGDAFISFLRVMRNLALVALPIVVGLAGDLAKWLKKVATATGDIGKTSPVVNAMIDSFRAWVGFLWSIIDLFVSLAGVASGAGDGILQWLTDGIKQFTAWLRSAEGQKKVQQFFEDTLPLVKETAKFIGLFVRIFLKGFQFLAPALAGFASVLNFVLGLIDAFLGFLNKIVSNPWGRAIRFALGQFLGLGQILKVLRLVVGVIGSLPTFLSRVGGAVGRYVMAPFRWAFGQIAKLFGGLPGRLAGLARKAPGAIWRALRGGAGLLRGAGAWLIRTVVAGARAIFGSVVRLGRGVLGRAVAGIRAGAGAVFNVGRSIIGWLLQGARALFQRGLQAGRNILGWLVSGIRSAGGRMVSAGRWLLSGLIKGFTSVGRFVWKAIKGLAGKIVDAVKSVLGIHSPSRVMQGLGQAMLAGLIKGFTSGDILHFVRKHLGGLPKLAAELAAKNVIGLPVRLVKGALGVAGDVLGGALPALAKGGVVTSRTVAELGEKGKEAVIPLSGTVLRDLARAITAAMSPTMATPALAGIRAPGQPAAAAGGRGNTYIDAVNLPPPPSSSLDPKTAAVQFARELKRRGL